VVGERARCWDVLLAPTAGTPAEPDEKRRVQTCRHCGVAIEQCPCVSHFRAAGAQDGPACEGSGWAGLVRSKHAALVEVLG
jgi:hypothetical protein